MECSSIVAIRSAATPICISSSARSPIVAGRDTPGCQITSDNQRLQRSVQQDALACLRFRWLQLEPTGFLLAFCGPLQLLVVTKGRALHRSSGCTMPS